MLDDALTDAIAAAVADAGQPPAVAARLNAWLKRLAEGDVGRDENTQFLVNVRKELIGGGVKNAD
jgi:hypothetical protein